MLHIVTLAAALLIAGAAPAHAAPVFAAIGSIVSVVKGSVLLSALARIGLSVLLSKLAAKLAPKPRQPGIKTDVTSTGAINPCAFPLGRIAVNGAHVCPPMSHGPENTYLTYVIELSDVPGVALDQWIIDGEVVTLGGTLHPDYGAPVIGGKFDGHAWIRFYNGDQTAADPGLLSIYGSYPARPWSAAMVGRGIAYAVCTFLYNRDLWSSFPQVRFVLGSIPVYDPRQDSTVGGAGAHRWADRSTWAPSNNPAVLAYNIHRGIAVQGHVWGGRDTAADLPLSDWFAAMNACDVLVFNGISGTEPRYRAGYEVFTDEEPAGVLEELLKAANADVADVGGQWRIVVGDPPMPVLAITDDDLLASQGGEKVRFPAPQQTFNAIAANYPEPAAQWEAQAAPPLFNAAWEAEDGNRRLPVTMDFPAVPYAAQVQRLMRGIIAQERRFLQHSEALPPDLIWLDPLDSITWTSARHGYVAKEFQIGRVVESLSTGVISLSLRERDPSDTAVPPGYFTPPGAVPASAVGLPARPVITSGDMAPGAATFVLGPDWTTLGAPVVLTSAAPSAALPATLLTGTFIAMRGGLATVGVEVTLAAAAPRQLRILSGATVKARVVDQIVTINPGSTRIAASGAVPDVPAGIATLRIEPQVEAIGLLPGETITITDYAARRVYHVR